MRDEVRKFAEAMERKLQERDDKGGWKDTDAVWLSLRMFEEGGELIGVIRRWAYGGLKGVDRKTDILDEAVDVANFAMMICDVFRLLEQEPSE